MKRIKTAICILVSALAFLLAGSPAEAGTTIEIFSSPNLHCDDTVAVYNPSNSIATANRPTIFVLHGFSGNWHDWPKCMDLQALCDKTGWRIICPDGFYSSWYLNNADPEKMQWRTFFWEECFPTLSAKYNLTPDNTFIAGLSMGGHGAMNIFLDHPELFKGAGSMSGVLDLRYAGGSVFMIPEILGKKSIKDCDEYSAIHRLERLADLGRDEARSKLLIIACGTEDKSFFPCSKTFEARCHQMGLRYIAHYSEGKHDWKFWPYMLPYFIEWFSESLAPVSAPVLNKTAFTEDTRPVFNVLDYGAVADGQTDCTAAFNKAIECCSEAKGILNVPAGQYLCSTIELKSNMELHLEKDAEIVADLDPEHYSSFVPKRDMSCYDSGDGTVNQNNSKDLRWNRALILANDVENITISGEGKVNGRHVFDALGEEHMRGPHTFIFGDCRNVVMKDITIVCAANYAFMGYAITEAEFSNIKIREGWDGIHIRGAKNVVIRNCDFQTGDDSIAGGYWENMLIKDCKINSSCNGIRMIMPSDGLTICNCTFKGPGLYPHRTSGEKRRTNMLFGVVLEPGGWGAAPGDLHNIKISDCTMSNVLGPVAVSISRDNTAYDLTISNITATGVYGTFSPVVTYNDKGFQKICITNCTIER